MLNKYSLRIQASCFLQVVSLYICAILVQPEDQDLHSAESEQTKQEQTWQNIINQMH